MSTAENQTVNALRNLRDELDRIIDQLTPAAFEVVGYDLSVAYRDIDRTVFNMECAFDLEVGE